MAKNNKKDRFVFWMPCEIEKGGKSDKPEERVMRLKGIASTNDRDSDGEVLDPDGFDLSFFKSSGMVNWHHQAKDRPMANIGEPEKAEIQPKGLYVECLLYPGSPLANEVFDLAELLEKNSKTRRLGFSIEGKVLERDPLDDNHITKSKITGLAVTHIPKNPATLCEIMKGERNGFDMEWDEENIWKAEDEDDGTENGSGNGIEEGEKPTIVKDDVGNGDMGNQEMNGEEELEAAEKALDTTTGKPLIKESLDPQLKPTCLSKGEVFDRIFAQFPTISIPNSKQVYTIIEKVAEDMNTKTQITAEAIQKAFDILGLPGAGSNDINKAEGGFTSTDAPSVAGMAAANGSREAFFKDMGDGNYKKMYKGEAEDGSEDEEADDKVYVKKGDEYEVKPGEGTGLEKAQTNEIGASNPTVEIAKAFGDVVTGLAKQNAEMFKAIGTVLQGVTETQNRILERLEGIESQPAAGVGRKSVSNVRELVRQGFNKGDQNELGEGNEQRGNSKQLSLTQNRREIINLFNKLSFNKGELDPFYGQAVVRYESSGQILEDVRRAIKDSEGITFVS